MESVYTVVFSVSFAKFNKSGADFLEAQYWHQKWHDEKIGFHQADVNKRLKAFWSDVVELAAHEGRKPCVFVPLCGKSLDMLWLHEQGCEVLGIELSEKAVEAFFAENALTYNRVDDGEFVVFQGVGNAAGIKIMAGDFFKLTPVHTASCTLLYDRASLIAMNADMRADYTEHLGMLLASGLRGLLLTISYDQDQMSGPPFSVSDETVQVLLEKCFDIQLLAHYSGPEKLGNLAGRGLETLDERVHLLVRK